MVLLEGSDSIFGREAADGLLQRGGSPGVRKRLENPRVHVIRTCVDLDMINSTSDDLCLVEEG